MWVVGLFLQSTKFTPYQIRSISLNMTEIQLIFERDENIAGKGENAGYQHFLLFPGIVFLTFSHVI